MQLDLRIILFSLLLGILIPMFSAQGAPAAKESGTQTKQSNPKRVEFVLRLGEGGFRDRRSPIRKLGGGQNTLDIKSGKSPVTLSISGESYTNSPEPSHPYEISDMIAVNLLYSGRIKSRERLKYFVGAGVGRLKVPKSELEPGVRIEGNLVNLEAGINYMLFRRIGIYGALKYLHAQKYDNNVKLINFSERIILLGLSLNFGLWDQD